MHQVQDKLANAPATSPTPPPPGAETLFDVVFKKAKDGYDVEILYTNAGLAAERKIVVKALRIGTTAATGLPFEVTNFAPGAKDLRRAKFPRIAPGEHTYKLVYDQQISDGSMVEQFMAKRAILP